MLYLVSTPIGNLGDLSYRAVSVLQSCDLILCEDTRHSHVLLSHYGIKTPLKSFHKFNESATENAVIALLKEGKNCALISDAGTPLFADPGHSLVLRCKAEGLEVTTVPGACAALSALVLSGFPTFPFQCIGFLPKKEQELRATFSEILLYQGTTICYETPHRIEKALHLLSDLAPKRPLCIARELTKLHEETLHGTAAELSTHFASHPPRGEMVLLIGPSGEKIDFDHLTLEEHVAFLEKELHLTKKEAIQMVAKVRGLPKREVYKTCIQDLDA
ncbi:MAG: 16S rRNA (cytidine(1402)-2'-O)-methyltransferase [Verrucomicrobia bacterium]|nr:16S rRNA (cytidine(1402)-2'-O)-methyltransferase [Verrucomicrobiota bacterium]